jgi:ATF/CREB family transcription factor
MTGLTPGGTGSMFPAPSPNSQALFAQLASGGATPGTIDFHRTAMSAAAKREQTNGVQRPSGQSQQAPPQQPPSVTSQSQEIPNGAVVVKSKTKPASGPFDPHDNDAANGLYMLAQGRNGARPNTRGKVKKNPATNGRRQADEAPAIAPPNKKSKANNGAVTMPEDMDMSDESNIKYDEKGTKSKMTDEEKRKNLLERNR